MKKQFWHAVKLFHAENTSKQQKNGGFCEELLSENDLEAVLVNFCYYEDIVSMLLRSSSEAEISTRTLLELCQLTKQLIS